MDTSYIVPAQTRIGHVHLKVSDIERSLKFYRDLLGFEVTLQIGTQAAFLSAGSYHPLGGYFFFCTCRPNRIEF